MVFFYYFPSAAFAVIVDAVLVFTRGRFGFSAPLTSVATHHVDYVDRRFFILPNIFLVETWCFPKRLIWIGGELSFVGRYWMSIIRRTSFVIVVARIIIIIYIPVFLVI